MTTTKKKIAWHHQEAKLKTWSRRGHIERPDNFFSNIDFFSLISNIKSSTGTKYIWTTSCRNWKACIFSFFFFLFQSPPSFKKILPEQKKKTTVCIIQITSRCTHFGFQDKEKHQLNYWWNMNKVLPIIRQENNTFFFSPHFCFGSRQYLQRCKATTLSKNSTSEYEKHKTESDC